ncbi:MAG: hypothetical protein ACXVCY_16985 [Pseudobdellovibrionaceae bacterium]
MGSKVILVMSILFSVFSFAQENCQNLTGTYNNKTVFPNNIEQISTLKIVQVGCSSIHIISEVNYPNSPYGNSKRIYTRNLTFIMDGQSHVDPNETYWRLAMLGHQRDFYRSYEFHFDNTKSWFTERYDTRQNESSTIFTVSNTLQLLANGDLEYSIVSDRNMPRERVPEYRAESGLYHRL